MNVMESIQEKSPKQEFSDPTKEQRALNEIHNFVQGKLSVQRISINLTQLKVRSKISDKMHYI